MSQNILDLSDIDLHLLGVSPSSSGGLAGWWWGSFLQSNARTVRAEYVLYGEDATTTVPFRTLQQ